MITREYLFLKEHVDEVTAEAGCKDCLGRGVIGKDTITGKKIICDCVIKKVESLIEEYRHGENK